MLGIYFLPLAEDTPRGPHLEGEKGVVSKLAKEMKQTKLKQAIPRSKKWRDVKQSIIRFIT
jgi:hypothetical protein